MPTFINRESGSLKSRWLIWTVLTVAVLVGAYFLFFNKKSTYQFITVTRGSITESVSVTGNTTPNKSVSLSFSSSGIISNVYSDLGRQVRIGEVLAELNMNDLTASLRQAEAGVLGQQAELEALTNSSDPIDASETFIVSLRNSYLQLETAVLRYSDTLFNNSTSVNPSINIRTQSQNEETSIENERLIVGEKMEKFRNSLAKLNKTSDNTTIKNTEAIGRDAINYISIFLNHLGNITKNLTPENSGLTQAVIDAHRISINTASQAVSTADSSEQTAYNVWNSAPQNLGAKRAAIESAKANVESAKARIQNAQIVAPISGIITKFDAKIGQLASLGTPLISIMSDTGYEVEAGVSEIDVGKISIGNPVSMTLDAFQNETFTGRVFYIAPAETSNQGVVNYQVKVSFDKSDSRLKSGLTANMEIQTRQKEDVLILPQYAILQNDEGTFVEIVENDVVKQNPVTLGLQDQKGNVEVISGVTEGEQVRNIGLKTQ